MNADWFEKLLRLKLAEAVSNGNLFSNPELSPDVEQPGAYVLIHPQTRHLYVGSTDDLYERKYKHRWHIERGDHRNLKVRQHYAENPTDQIWFLTWFTKTRDDAYDLEQKFLDHSWGGEKSLNISPDARTSNKGVLLSDERKDEIRQKVTELWKDPEYRERMSKAAKKHFADPENRARMAERVKLANTRPAFRASQAEKANVQWADPDARSRKSEEVKAYLSVPANRAKMLESRRHLFKQVSAEGVVYPSIKAAGRHFGISDSSVMKRIRSPRRVDWFLVEN